MSKSWHVVEVVDGKVPCVTSYETRAEMLSYVEKELIGVDASIFCFQGEYLPVLRPVNGDDFLFLGDRQEGNALALFRMPWQEERYTSKWDPDLYEVSPGGYVGPPELSGEFQEEVDEGG